MPVDVRIPTLGESVSEGVIVRWIKQDGEAVAVDDPLLELETDKASVEIPAQTAGVLRVVSQEGETVAAGFNAPTFLTIVDLSRLQVDAYVDEVDIGKIRVGGEGIFTVDAFPATEFQARVVAIYPKAFVQDNVVKYIVALEIVTPYEGKLRPEMTASVVLRLESRSVLAVPSKALRRERGRTLMRLVRREVCSVNEAELTHDGYQVEP